MEPVKFVALDRDDLEVVSTHLPVSYTHLRAHET